MTSVMKRKIIAIDVDDVLADSTTSMRLQVNDMLGINLPEAAYLVPGDQWGYYERVWNEHGLLDRISYQMFEAEMIKDQSHVPFLAGAEFALTELHKYFDIVIITARNPAWEAATREWLKDYLGSVINDVYFAGSFNIEGSKSKGQQAREIGAAYLIDDAPINCRTALDEGVIPILFGNYGWHHDKPQGIIHCLDWPAVLDYFNSVV